MRKIGVKYSIFLVLLVFAFGMFLYGCPAGTSSYGSVSFKHPEGEVEFAFSVAADMRSFVGDDSDYFRGVCETIETGGSGVLMITPGDMDCPGAVYDTVRKYLSKSVLWYPVVGNHDLSELSLDWIDKYIFSNRETLKVVNIGPGIGNYSFNYMDVHFIVINEYYANDSSTGSDGDVGDELYLWLKGDLEANRKCGNTNRVFVIGHEPAFPMPDEENGRLRHEGDSLDKYPKNRDRFWSLLSDFNVMAYVCGHTHNFSATEVENVWQIDAGHARGLGDRGARSTFIMVYVMRTGGVWLYVYRIDFSTGAYRFTRKFMLD